MKQRFAHDRLLQLVSYDPISGIFTRRNTGKVSGYLMKSGYVQLRVDSVLYYGHILAWFYVHGVWPTDRIDHKDNIRHHNWIDNLREATHKQNNQSAVLSKTNTSGFKGVSFSKSMGKYRATIWVNSKPITLGYTDNPIEAAVLYDEAAVTHYGEFAKTNKQLGLL